MAETLKEKIVGTWKLKSWIFHNEQGDVVHYLGEGATGVLMYDQHGNMNAQLMKSDRPRFASDSINGATAEEALGAFNSYLAYYGRYHEGRPGEIVHTVEGSLFPNWLGNEQLRYGKIEGNTLVVSTPPIPAHGRDIVFYVTWEKVT